MPIYWYHGEIDPVADFAASKAAFDLAESRDKLFLRSLVLHLRDPVIRGR